MFCSFCRVYLAYHTIRQVVCGALLGTILAVPWFTFNEVRSFRYSSYKCLWFILCELVLNKIINFIHDICPEQTYRLWVKPLPPPPPSPLYAVALNMQMALGTNDCLERQCEVHGTCRWTSDLLNEKQLCSGCEGSRIIVWTFNWTSLSYSELHVFEGRALRIMRWAIFPVYEHFLLTDSQNYRSN